MKNYQARARRPGEFDYPGNFEIIPQLDALLLPCVVVVADDDVVVYCLHKSRSANRN